MTLEAAINREDPSGDQVVEVGGEESLDEDSSDSGGRRRVEGSTRAREVVVLMASIRATTNAVDSVVNDEYRRAQPVRQTVCLEVAESNNCSACNFKLRARHVVASRLPSLASAIHSLALIRDIALSIRHHSIQHPTIHSSIRHTTRACIKYHASAPLTPSNSSLLTTTQLYTFTHSLR